MSFFKKNYIGIILILVIILGFVYRINGLKANYSFWVDEASTARFGRSVLETGLPKIELTGFSERAYYTTAYLTGLAFKIFGANEFAARLPEVIFGTLVILAVYWLGKEIFNKYIGLGVSLFTAFSYIQIAWSRQARGYVILEFFFLLTLLFLWRFSKKGDIKSLVFLLVFLILSSLTHYLGLILVPIILIFLVIYNRRLFLSKIFPLLLIATFLIVFMFLGWRHLLNFLLGIKLANLIKGNFVAYYHSLFWRQYSLLTFLCFLGLISLWFKREKEKFWLFLLSLVVYFLVVSLFLHVPFEKYVLPIFPTFFLVAVYGLWQIAGLFFKDKKKTTLIFFLLVAFILFNGNKFSLKPRTFYTLNYDMREIPEHDYKGLYDLVKAKMAPIEKEKVAIVDISSDLPAWYLGEGSLVFSPRNDVAADVKINENTGAIFIHNLEEFKDVYQNHPYGFVVLVEHNFRFYPEGLVKFVRENLRLEKKEEFAWFSPDWNQWPIELYSWGFD